MLLYVWLYISAQVHTLHELRWGTQLQFFETTNNTICFFFPKEINRYNIIIIRKRIVFFKHVYQFIISYVAYDLIWKDVVDYICIYDELSLYIYNMMLCIKDINGTIIVKCPQPLLYLWNHTPSVFLYTI